jgi:hypothetical protein
MSGTAEIHTDATLTPSKLELLSAWMPTQPWFTGDAADIARVGSFRFVDPHGEVGIETILVASVGVTYQVPLTYRSEALPEAEDYFVGTMDHSVLGPRWVYDATGDPAYVDEIVRVIREGDTQAALSSGFEPDVKVEGSGVIMVANSSGTVKLSRVLDQGLTVKRAVGFLEGTWTQDGAERTAILATLH